jgi:hypothetical protein
MTHFFSKAAKLPSFIAGNDDVRRALLALSQAGALAGFHTTLAWKPESAFAPLVPSGMRAELGRRSYPEISAKPVHTHPGAN